MKLAFTFSILSIFFQQVSAQECAYPSLITEPSDTDKMTGTSAGDMLLWDGNRLCTGESTDDASCSDVVAKAYGSCVYLSDGGSLDCVDTFVFNDGSELISRGLDMPEGWSVVVGGTGCYDGAHGKMWTTFHQGEFAAASGNIDVYRYDLSGVKLDTDQMP